jgi:hypothetical protein
MKSQYRVRIVTEEKLQEDFNIAMSNIDDLSAAALNLTNGGPQAYSQFIELRDSFRSSQSKWMNGYKPVDVLL